MSIIDFIQRFFVFLIPGAIGLSFFCYLNRHKEMHYYVQFFVMLIYSFFALYFTNLFFHLIKSIWANTPYGDINIINFIVIQNSSLPVVYIVVASLISICASLIGTLLNDRNLIFKLANKLKITYRTGNGDVWENFMDNANYVVIRDEVTKRTYYGKIVEYSDKSQLREIKLKKVSVFDETSELLYLLDELYICRNYNEISIEIFDYAKDSYQKIEEETYGEEFREAQYQ